MRLRKMKEEDYDNLDENNEDPQYNEYEQQYKQQKPRKSGKRKGEKKRWDQLYELVRIHSLIKETISKRDKRIHEKCSC